MDSGRCSEACDGRNFGSLIDLWHSSFVLISYGRIIVCQSLRQRNVASFITANPALIVSASRTSAFSAGNDRDSIVFLDWLIDLISIKFD